MERRRTPRMGMKWAILVVAGLVAGCSGGIGGWFGGGRAPAPVEVAAPAVLVAGLPVAADGTVLVPAVRQASADRGRQGVILRAVGIAPTQGFHSPELRTVGERGADGIEVVELRARPPVEAEAVGAERTRALSVGRFYSNREMREIRGFRVLAGGNAMMVNAP